MSDDWIDKLQARLADDASDEVPKGWQTVRQICSSTGKSPRRIREIMQSATERGLAERRQFRIVIGGAIQTVPHYRPKA